MEKKIDIEKNLSKILKYDEEYVNNCNENNIKELLVKLYYDCADLLDTDKKIYSEINKINKLQKIKEKKITYDKTKDDSINDIIKKIMIAIYIRVSSIELEVTKTETLDEEIINRNEILSVLKHYKEFLKSEVELVSKKISELYLRLNKNIAPDSIVDSICHELGAKKNLFRNDIYTRVKIRNKKIER